MEKKSEQREFIINILRLLVVVILLGIIFSVINNKIEKNVQTNEEDRQEETENESTNFENYLENEEHNNDIQNNESYTQESQITTPTTEIEVPEINYTESTQQNVPETIVATIEYSCPFGYTLTNYQCVKETMKAAEMRYYCSSGILQGSVCIDEIRTSVYITSSAKASCSNYANTGLYQKCACEKSGGDFEVGGCLRKSTRRTAAQIEYICNYSETLSGTLCIGKEYINPTINYVCPIEYQQNGMFCYKY